MGRQEQFWYESLDLQSKYTPLLLLKTRISLTDLKFGAAMLLWGGFTMATVGVKSYATLMALHVLVGAAEAFVQGAVFYL